MLLHWGRLTVDLGHINVCSLNQRENDIRVFDEHGMEICARAVPASKVDNARHSES
jgi:hypothetical protein